MSHKFKKSILSGGVVERRRSNWAYTFCEEPLKCSVLHTQTSHQNSPIRGSQLTELHFCNYFHNEYYALPIYMLPCLLLFHYVRSQHWEMALFYSHSSHQLARRIWFSKPDNCNELPSFIEHSVRLLNFRFNTTLPLCTMHYIHLLN